MPYALNLELYFSVFLKPISLSLRGVGVLCYTAVSRNLSPPFPLLHCAWLVMRVRVLWACYTAVKTRARAPPPSPLRLASCARGCAVGVLCCTAVRARARSPVLHCAWLVVRVLCYTTVRTRARAPRSQLRVACCARGRVVGVLCCTAVRARAPPLFFSTALGLLCAQSEPEPKAPFSTGLGLLCVRAGCGRVVLRAVSYCSWGFALCNLLRVDLLCRTAVGGDPPPLPDLSCARPRRCAL